MSEFHIALIRHAEYEQPKGVPSAHLLHGLTAEGFEQARACARYLLAFSEENSVEIHHELHSSELLRAYETSRSIQKELDQEMSILQTMQLAERSTGPANNLTVTEIEKVLERDPRFGVPKKGWKSDPHYQLPWLGCESLWRAGARVKAYVESVLTDANTGKLTVFVGHGAAIRCAAVQMGVIKEEELKKYSMHYARPVFLSYKDQSWSHHSGEWKIRQQKDAVD